MRGKMAIASKGNQLERSQGRWGWLGVLRGV